MMRAIAIAALLPVLSACSIGPASPTLGYSDIPAADGGGSSGFELKNPFASNATGAAAAKPSGRPGDAQRTQVASLNTSTAGNAFGAASEKAPKGALADRDYTATALNVDAALASINDYRREKGLRALAIDDKLTRAAKAHSTDLAKWDRISHYGSDGSNPWDRVKRAGFKAQLAAENVGTGQASFDEVFKGWKQSPGHNKNLLLADATHMGIALVRDPRTEFKTFWTLVLGTPL